MLARSLASVAVIAIGIAGAARAQTAPLQFTTIAYDYDTGWVSNTSVQPQVVISFPVLVSGAEWLRLYFDSIDLGDAVLRITSYEDGDAQELRARHCVEWQNSSCYLNGSTVQVEVEAPPHSGPCRLVLGRVDAGTPFVPQESQCGPTDDRVLSNDPRVARMFNGNAVCTAWLIDDCCRCMLSAGHCLNPADIGAVAVHFNVPLSDPNGMPVMSATSDQYPVDVASRQFSDNGVGDDWAYFGVFANSNTGLTAGLAQG